MLYMYIDHRKRTLTDMNTHGKSALAHGHVNNSREINMTDS